MIRTVWYVIYRYIFLWTELNTNSSFLSFNTYIAGSKNTVLVQVYLGESYETCQKYLGHPNYTLHKEKKIESVIFMTVKLLWCVHCKFIIIIIYILIWQCILWSRWTLASLFFCAMNIFIFLTTNKKNVRDLL